MARVLPLMPLFDDITALDLHVERLKDLTHGFKSSKRHSVTI
jgi:hypothetical protein